MNFKSCSTSECHSKIKQGVILHGPIKANGCYLCHTPVMNSHKFTLVENMRKVCTKCHDDLEEAAIKEANHKTYLELEYQKFSTHSLDIAISKTTQERLKVRGIQLYNNKLDCLSCHNPHNSSQKGLLRIEASDAQKSLCLSCHEEKIAFHPHPIREELCASCHHFHKGGEKSALIKLSKNKTTLTCFECHQEKNVLQGIPLKSKDCLACHQNENYKSIKQIKKAFQHVPILFSSVPDSTSKKEISLKLLTPLEEERAATETKTRLTCFTCHLPHTESAGENVDLHYLREGHKVMKFCASCHGAEAQSLYTKFHEITAREKNEKK